MGKQRTAKIIKPVQYSPEWNVHQKIGRFAQETDRLPNAREVRKAKPKTAPPCLLPMVF